MIKISAYDPLLVLATNEVKNDLKIILNDI
ncbi:hypothetical protein SAMN05880574_11432 [Chryseobacterium sp. RU37D]|nr:hypothetical protein SAMN05880574_11432 [Chryseobacterium sp. RU37D]